MSLQDVPRGAPPLSKQADDTGHIHMCSYVVQIIYLVCYVPSDIPTSKLPIPGDSILSPAPVIYSRLKKKKHTHDITPSWL